MEQINYEGLGRIVVALANLRKKADESGLLYVSSALSCDGIFNLRIYDDKIDTVFHETPYMNPLERPEEIAACIEQIKWADAFVDGFIASVNYEKERAAKEEQKAAAEADKKAAEFIGSLNGEAVENEMEF